VDALRDYSSPDTTAKDSVSEVGMRFASQALWKATIGETFYRHVDNTARKKPLMETRN
jgi:hypothetical protein